MTAVFHRRALLLLLLLVGAPALSVGHGGGLSLLSNCVFTVDLVAGGPEATVVASAPVDLSLRLRRQVVLLDGYSGVEEPVRWGDLRRRHLRRLHVVFISEDLDTVMHVHPEDFDPALVCCEPTASSPDAAADANRLDEVFHLRNLTFPRGGRYAMLVTYEVRVAGPFADCDASGLARDDPSVTDEVQVLRHLDVALADDTAAAADAGAAPWSADSPRVPPLTPTSFALTRPVRFREGTGATQRQPDAVSLANQTRACCEDEGEARRRPGRRLQGRARDPAPGETSGAGACYEVAFGLAGDLVSSPPGPTAGFSDPYGYPPAGIGAYLYAPPGVGDGPRTEPGSADAATCVGVILHVAAARLATAASRIGDVHVDPPLVPYLGAGAHLTLASADLAYVAHGHAMPVPVRGVGASRAHQLASELCVQARNASAPNTMDELPPDEGLVGNTLVAALMVPGGAPRGQHFKLFASFADRTGVATAGFVFYLADSAAKGGGGSSDSHPAGARDGTVMQGTASGRAQQHDVGVRSEGTTPRGFNGACTQANAAAYEEVSGGGLRRLDKDVGGGGGDGFTTFGVVLVVLTGTVGITMAQRLRGERAAALGRLQRLEVLLTRVSAKTTVTTEG